MKLSLCVHSYNEAEALRRLVLSSLPLREVFDEWVILDHRSDDDTPAVVAALEPELSRMGIRLTALHEPRDLSAEHTFADVRTRTLKAAHNPVLALLDADFILGPAFLGFAQRALAALAPPNSTYHCARYAVPCVWDHLTIDASGRITSHGRVWVHKTRPRFLVRDAVHYVQNKDRGRWEGLVVDDRRRGQRLDLTPVSGHAQTRLAPSAVISNNVKPPARIALRDTMTMFMQDAVSAGQRGGWLENYAVGAVRSQGAYVYDRVHLAGWRLFTTNLNVTSESPVCA